MLRRILLFVLALCIGASAEAWRLRDQQEVWVIYSCNELVQMLFVSADGHIEGMQVDTEDQQEAALTRAATIPERRHYFVHVMRHCPYYYRREA